MRRPGTWPVGGRGELLNDWVPLAAKLEKRMPAVPNNRQAKGVAFIGAVKLLRNYRKTRPIDFLSPRAEALLSEHLLPTDWYPWAPVSEIIEATSLLLLRKSEAAAIEMGIAGGKQALTSYHKHFVRPEDPKASLLAMRHSWRVYFDWGSLNATAEGERLVLFVLEGYPEVTAAHGCMIVGWHRAAGFVAGADTTHGEIVECPWRDGSTRLVHRVEF